RHEHLSRAGERSDARAGVHRYSADLVAGKLALTRVQPRAHLDPDALHVRHDRPGAADCAGRPVERCEEAVARGVDLPPSETFQISADALDLTVEESAPSPLSEMTRL